MTALYEAYKNKLYAFCCILLNDRQKAGFAAANVMNEVWGKLASRAISTEDAFLHFILAGAAAHCRSLLFHKDAKGFKVSKTTQIEIPPIENEEYLGSVPGGMACLQASLEKIDPHQRFIYLLHMAGGLSFKEIAQIVQQREAVTKYCYELASAALCRDLGQESGGTLQAGHVLSLLEQALEADALPETVAPSCLKQIKICAKSPVPSKKVLIPALCGVLCVIGVLAAVILVPDKGTASSGNETAVSGSDGTDSSADTGAAYTPAALDADLTYYADIEIEEYGTITVQLDQESAPVSAANFVALAEDGFYNGLTFHRIMEGFMMQGGDPNGDGTGGSGNTIVGEFADNGYENNLSHTRGAISMARSDDYDSASSQFFIVHEDSTSLDGQYAVFGYVTEGMEIVDSICESAEPVDDNGTIEADAQPVITSVSIRTD